MCDLRLERYPRLRHPAGRNTHLLLVRHGRTLGNLRGILQGMSDLPLDRFGSRQADRIAERIANEFAVDIVFSSPLARAMSTASAIASRSGLRTVVVPDLREIDFGEFEGSTLDQLLQKRPDLAASLANASDLDVAWPGGESRSGFYARVWKAFHAILHDHPAERVVVVAHGGVIGSFSAMLRGRSPNDPAAYDIANCGLTHVEVRSDHSLVHLHNDVCHLSDLIEGEDE